MSSLRYRTLRGLLAVSAVSLGCREQDPNRGQVTGAVVVDGQPAAEGAISFTPIDRNSTATGGVIVDGRYSVSASVGPSKVAIRVPKVLGQRKLYDTPDSPVQSVMDESLPAEFNDKTTLKFDVRPGPNTKDFSLKSK